MGFDQAMVGPNYDALFGLDLEAPLNAQEPQPLHGMNTSVHLRLPFHLSRVTDLASVRFAALRMRYDDGFVAYLNGQEVA